MLLGAPDRPFIIRNPGSLQKKTPNPFGNLSVQLVPLATSGIAGAPPANFGCLEHSG